MAQGPHRCYDPRSSSSQFHSNSNFSIGKTFSFTSVFLRRDRTYAWPLYSAIRIQTAIGAIAMVYITAEL